ncbi:MAG: hypothetical protein P4L33_11550 [Capsulimonadaceae bacterium]|nr:hypothetical protein [Capsulimonadaceae bacterium]
MNPQRDNREPSSSDAASSFEASARPAPRLRARAIVLGLLLLPLNAFWVVDMEYVRYSAHPTTVSLFFNCIFALVVMAGINSLVVRVRPSWALTQAELLLVYSMLCVGSCMAGHDFAQVLVGSLSWPFAWSTPSHNYEKLFWHWLPRWAMTPNVDATYGFYHGNDTLYTREHLMAWLPAIVTWTGFTTVLLYVMQCINVILRKQWTENERLGYPLVRMPLDLTSNQPLGSGEGKPSLFRNRLFWIGFAIAAAIDIVNSINYFYPAVPSILTAGAGQTFDLHLYTTTKPWNAIGWTPVTFYPFVLGLGVLLPLDFLFSCWFFYITWKLQAIGVSALAWDADPQMPYANYQALGAYILFFVASIQISLPYLKQVWRRAAGLVSTLDDSDEPMRYRTALTGMAVGLVLLIGFAMCLGMSAWLAVAFFFLYFAIALAITRMRAEMGTPVHDLHFTGPDWTLSTFLGPHALGGQNMAAFSLLFWFNRAYRCHPMPFQLEGLKMAEQSGAAREMRKWIWALMLAGVFGMICAFWAILHLGYVHGNPRFGNEPWDRYVSWLTTPKPANGAVGVAVLIGFVAALAMQVLRATGGWWPFHPLAYAVSGSWEMNLLWMPLFLAWLVKWFLLRFGGGKSYGTALPFFYGLILGQFIPGSLLNFWGLATNNPTYQFWQ